MVRPKSEGRSRGCDVCKKRKVKCDEKLPECTPCMKGKRKCTGAVSGMVFLNAKNDSESSKGNKIVYERNEESSSSSFERPDRARTWSQPERDEPHDMDSLLVHWPREHSSSPRSRYYGSRENSVSPISPRPTTPLPFSGNHVYTQQLFTALNRVAESHGITSWLSSFPNIVSENTPLGKIVLAISLVYHGNLYGEKDATMEGYKWYGYALEDQRRGLELGSQTSPTAEEICVPIMLALFENISTQSSDAYRQHVFAAMRLLEMKGPESCQEDIFKQLLGTLRLQILQVNILRRQPCSLSEQLWLTIPYLHNPLSAADRMLNILLKIPTLLSRLDNFNSSPNNQFLANEKVAVESETHGILLELDHCWDDIIPDSKSIDPHSLLLQDYTSSNDATTPIAIAHFRCAKTLCLYILSCFYPRYEQDLTSFCSATLALAEVIQVGDDLSSSYSRLVILLQTVSLATPFKADQQKACAILEGWAQRTGFLGIAIQGKSELWHGSDVLQGFL